MKKGLLVMPLMAVSLLASCGGGSKIPDLPSDLDLYRKKYNHDPKTGDILETSEYEYNDKNLLTKFTTFNIFHPDTKYYTETTYDENNNIKSEDMYTIKSGVETARTKTVYENQYDAEKRLIQVIEKMTDTHGEWLTISKQNIEYKTDSRIEEHYLHNTLTQEYSLSKRSIYTCDKNGCLVNQKDYDYEENEARETVITVDKHGCAILTELYYLSMDGVRGEKTVEVNTTYLNNLWYRPLKSTQIPVDRSLNKMVAECGYNDNQQIISEKFYEGEEKTLISHYTYEY